MKTKITRTFTNDGEYIRKTVEVPYSCPSLCIISNTLDIGVEPLSLCILDVDLLKKVDVSFYELLFKNFDKCKTCESNPFFTGGVK